MRMLNYLRSLKGKLTLLVVAAILLPLLVAALIARQVFQERMQHSFRTELETALGSITLILNWVEQDLIAEITRIASNDLLEDQLAQGAVPELKKNLTTQRKVVALELLAVFDLHHALVASSKFKSKSLLLDFNRLEQLQIVSNDEEDYLVYVVPITRRQRTLGYVAGGILLSDQKLLEYLQTARIANVAFWLKEKLLLTDIRAPQVLAKPNVPVGELFETEFNGEKYKGGLRAFALGGEHLDFACFISTRQMAEAELQFTLTLFAVVVVLFVLCLSFLGNLLERVIRPLHHLTAYARQLSANHFTPRVDSALARLAQTSQDEVGKLADAFVHMERQLRAYIQGLTESTRANERVQSELRIAREIQMSMLPHANDGWQRDARFAIAAALEPAREVGGDFYDYFMIDDVHLAFAIGDVSGKGIPASLFMAVSKALVRAVTNLSRTFARQGLLPQEVLERVNHELCRENDLLMFVTLFYGVLNVNTGELNYSSAGHNPPFRIAPAAHEVALLPPAQSRPLGIKASSRYETRRVQLAAGEALLLYTDGLTEARAASGELFSEARLGGYLRDTEAEDVQALLQSILQEIKRFAHGAPAYDDLTMLLLQYQPQPRALFTLRNRWEELQQVLQQLEGFGVQYRLAPEEVLCLRLVVEEILSNTIKYGYTDTAEHEMRIAVRLHENRLTLRFEDEAQAFDPLAAGSQSRGTDAGGRGLKLVRAMMDDWQYRREGEKNILMASKLCGLVAAA